jgi:hypothetical protein
MRPRVLPLEGQVERPRAQEPDEEREHRAGAEAGAVDGNEVRMLVDRQRELERFPE